jgi:hypothetical protein
VPADRPLIAAVGRPAGGGSLDAEYRQSGKIGSGWLESRRIAQMNSVTWLGAVLALLGILGLAIPSLTTSQTEDVIKLGDLKVQGTKTTYHVVPQALSGGVLVLGVVLIGVGVYSKRSR